MLDDHGRRTRPLTTLVLDDAFVAAARVHEPSAAAREAEGAQVRAVPAVPLPARSGLQVYLLAVLALVALVVGSAGLDRLLG